MIFMNQQERRQRKMDSLERIFEKFEDVNEFAGFAPKKEYRADTKEEIREKVGSGDTMDLILYYQHCSTEEAFLDGFRFGMKFLIENIL